MSISALIFARGGSKGLPNKNIRCLRGKPLIAWSIECAQSVPGIKEVIVSTDSEEIAAISRSLGARVPFIRPIELATDESPEWLSWRHALDFLRESDLALPEVMLSLPATAPLRAVSDVEDCLIEYRKGGCDAVVTVAEAFRNPYFNMVRKNIDETVEVVIKDLRISRRQDAPTVYDLTTVCYVVDPKFVLSHNSLFEGRVRAVQVPRERAIDIDTIEDLEYAEFLLTKQDVSR